MPLHCPHRPLHRVLVLVPILFGLVTLFAAGRVLLGTDPGYVVFRPLLLFNAAMGIVYLGTALAIRNDLGLGRLLAWAVALVNLAVLVAIVLHRNAGGAVALESVRAMTFRTAVWLAIAGGLWWLVRSERRLSVKT